MDKLLDMYTLPINLGRLIVGNQSTQKEKKYLGRLITSNNIELVLKKLPKKDQDHKASK